MVIFTDLPSEVWHLIAQYLPKSQLLTFKYLNSFFLNYCMDLQWKRVNVQINGFHSKMPKKPFHFLRGLALPFVAPRTKIVSVALVWYSSLTGTTKDVTFADALGCLLDSLTLLPNLTCLSVHYATFHLASFFQTITSSSLRWTLRELILTGCRMEMFASIQEYCTHESPFDNLTKLTLVLHPIDDDESSLILEPFLRSLAPTLQSLMITNRFSLDLSPLFDALSKPDSLVLFPKLTSFSLFLHFSESFRTSPQSLRHFLRTNNHLQHLHLDMTSIAHPEGDELLGVWLADLVNDNIHLPSLQTLDICPPDTQTGISALLSLIKLTVPTLSSLRIRGWFKPGVVNQMIDAITEFEGQPKMLKSLILDITELSVPCLELVARKLPHLEKLIVSAVQVVGSGQNSFYELLRERRYNSDSTSTQDVFHAWKLQDLKIDVDSEWDDDENATRTVAGIVPALAHLRGKDIGNESDDSVEEFWDLL